MEEKLSAKVKEESQKDRGEGRANDVVGRERESGRDRKVSFELAPCCFSLPRLDDRGRSTFSLEVPKYQA